MAADDELRELTDDDVFEFFSEDLMPQLVREDGRRYTTSKEVREVVLLAKGKGCTPMQKGKRHPFLQLPEGKTTPEGKSVIPFPSTTKNRNAGKNLRRQLNAAGIDV